MVQTMNKDEREQHNGIHGTRVKKTEIIKINS